MRVRELIIENRVNIDKSLDGGSLEGYVVDTADVPIANYLKSQGADKHTINHIVKSYKRLGLIRNMYVDPEERGQGIGGDLVSDAIDDAAVNGADGVLLVADVTEENAIDLVKWYEGFGFEKVGMAGGDPIMILDLK